MVKRFYKTVSVGEADNGHTLLLDGRSVKTPQRATLAVPTSALAEAIAEEWRAQGEDIKPETMPLTRLAHAAIDGAAHRALIAEEALGYARTDLVCYRAEHPDELVIRQARQWTPLLDWLHETRGARLRTASGIGFVEQPPEALALLAERLAQFDPFALVVLHTATSITGSLTLALALAEGRLNAEEAFALSQLDEAFQAEKWGTDAEAETRAAKLLADLKAAERFLRLSGA
ncbi:MAG TPA: ATP12 family protein [Rhizomicrobium sp.]|jgi:chaperone required for assembly of F1-ATPase